MKKDANAKRDEQKPEVMKKRTEEKLVRKKNTKNRKIISFFDTEEFW